MTPLIKECYPFAADVLPHGWIEAPVRAITLEIRSGFSSGKHNTDGIGIPHLRPMSVTPKGKVTLQDVRYISPSAGDLRLVEGDILFTNTSSTIWVGKSGVVTNPRDWAFSNHMTRLRLVGGMTPEFFAKQLHFLCRCGYFAHHCTKHINQSSIAPSLLRDRVPVRVPPIAEQRRIVARLDTLEARSLKTHAQLSKIPSQLARTRQSLFANAFLGMLTADWRKKKKVKTSGSDALQLAKRLSGKKVTRPHNFQFEYEIPDSWTWASLDAITSLVTSGSRDWTPYYRDDGYGVFLLTQNVRPLRLDLSSLRRVSPPNDDRDKVRSQVRENDLLVTIVGAGTGQVCRVPTELPNHFICQSLALLRPSVPQMGRYLELFFNAETGAQAQFKKIMYGQGRPHLDFDGLKQIAIPLPPLREQQEIIRRLDIALARLDATSAAHAVAVAKLNNLDQAILARAFRGQLVSQDPADEPAGILLDRLAIEAAAKPNQPKKHMSRKIKSSVTREIRPILDFLRAAKNSVSPEDLFHESGRDETDLEQVEKFYIELRQFVNNGKVKEERPDSATVLLTAKS